MWSRRLLFKYWAIQLAGWIIVFPVVWLLAEGLGWPRWTVWAICGVWVAKDFALYPLLWRAYDSRGWTALAYPIPGAEGVALRRVNPTGAVRIGGELWNAELAAGARAIEEGETVRVTGRDGMTLLVEACADSRTTPGG